MASQITHLALADKLYDTYFSRHDRQQFYIGNIFPDIRKLAGFDRTTSHIPVGSIADVQAQADPFVAGMLLHHLVDNKREEFITASRALDLFTLSKYRQSLFKLFEDIQLYDKLTDWPAVITMIANPVKGERAYPVTEAQLTDWHASVSAYFSQPPTPDSRRDYVRILALPDDWLAEAEPAISGLRSSEKAGTIVRQLYDDIETIIT